MRKLIFAFASLAVLGCGGDRYELISSHGVVYRLDRRTGEVVYINQFTAFRVEIPSEEETEEAAEEAGKPRKGRYTFDPSDVTP